MHHPIKGPAKGRSRPEDEYRDASRGERLQRVLADAGVASRRACEQLIKDGQVRVNGRVLTDLPIWVDPSQDRILVEGRPIKPAEDPVYVMLNKPPRTLCAVSDEPGADRLTVVDLVRHHSGARLYPVGRLDYDAMGLLLLTNDGDLAHKLTHPRFGGLRVYEAAVSGVVPPRTMQELNRRLAGRSKDKGDPAPVSIVGFEDGKTVLRVTVRESRGRSVQDLLAKIGHHVKRLERIAFGPLLLKGIARGEWRDLERHEIVALKRGATEPVALPERARLASKAGKRKPRSNARSGSSRPSRPTQARPDRSERVEPAPGPKPTHRGANPRAGENPRPKRASGGASGIKGSKGATGRSRPGIAPKNRPGANRSRRKPE